MIAHAMAVGPPRPEPPLPALVAAGEGKAPRPAAASAERVDRTRAIVLRIEDNTAVLINDFVLGDDRTGNPFAMLFAAQILLVSKGGNAWRQSDYRRWLAEAGFASVDIVPTPSPATVVFAK